MPFVEFSVSPVKTRYDPGEHVVFSGRLWCDAGPFGHHWAADQPVNILTDDVVVGKAMTDHEGRFSASVKLPFTPGTYSFRAVYPGCDWHAHHYFFPVHLGFKASPSITLNVAPLPVFVCNWCGAGFVTKEELDKHKLVCPLRPRFVCPYCGKGFDVEVEYKAHLAVCPARPVPVPWYKDPRIVIPLGVVAVGITVYAVGR